MATEIRLSLVFAGASDHGFEGSALGGAGAIILVLVEVEEERGGVNKWLCLSVREGHPEKLRSPPRSDLLFWKGTRNVLEKGTIKKTTERGGNRKCFFV